MVIEGKQAPTAQNRTRTTDFLLFDGQTLIGTASLDRADRAGGTLICSFTPTSAYDLARHAAVEEGASTPLVGRRRLNVKRADGVHLTALDVCIYDHEVNGRSRTREAYIIGIELDVFDSYVEDQS